MFFANLLAFIKQDLVVTTFVCVLASFCVGFVMRFFVKTALVKLDDYVYGKHTDDKTLALYQTIKSIVYVVLAGILTAFALHRLMAICPFPMDNSKALAMFYFIPMFALQWFFDAHMKKIACKVFGLPYDGSDEKEERPVKEPKPKYHTKKVKYIIDEEGNEVPVE